ncbi:hypothetical protein Q8F55_000026 [Vanrija albida]|uniref:F-box domain-containing protein n=1 Tax=Vanrija albida TaxID=181172 RepID=A0ABR3QCP8_9TREE
MCTIDHTAYPYITDLIFAASDVDALYALRGASRAFRDRAESLIVKQIEVRYVRGDFDLVSRAGVPCPAPERIVTPSFKYELNKTLDLTTFVSDNEDFPDFLDLFPELLKPRLLRRVGDAVVSPGGKLFSGAKIVVDFIDFHPYPIVNIDIDEDDYGSDEFDWGLREFDIEDIPAGEPRVLPKDLRVGRLPRAVTNYIAHFWIDELSISLPRRTFLTLYDNEGPGEASVVVLVLHPPSAPGKTALAVNAAVEVCVSLKQSSITIVGIDDIDDGDWRATFLQWVADDLGVESKVFTDTRFLSMREWKEEVAADPLFAEAPALVTEWVGRESVGARDVDDGALRYTGEDDGGGDDDDVSESGSGSP